MIRHEIFLCGWSGHRLAQPVSALTISMVESAFKAALMPTAGFASLRRTSPEATGMAAIAMPSVTMRADEEPGVTIGSRAELLVEGEVVRCRHPELGSVDFRRLVMAT